MSTKLKKIDLYCTVFSAIFLNFLEAFRIAQNTDNSTYLEKIEKDIEDKVNTIAEAAATEPKKTPSGAAKSNDNNINTVDDIEIHTEADEPDKPKSNSKTEIHTESDIQDAGNEKHPINKTPKIRHEERTQRVEVLGPVIEIKKPSDENEQTEINKEIVVTGRPKLNGKVTIDTTFQYKHPHKTKIKKNGEHKEKLTGFSIDDVAPVKSPSNATSNDMRLKTTTHARQHKAYHDYSVAHKVLNSNIEKLRNVLQAIEGAPANNKASEQGIEVVKKKSGRLGALSGQTQHPNEIEASLQLSGTPQVIPPYLPQAPAGYKVVKSQSTTQTTVTKLPGTPVTQQPANDIVSVTKLPGHPVTQQPANKIVSANTSPVQNSAVTVTPLQNASAKQVQLPQTSGIPVRANAGLPQASAPGLHVVQGNGNLPNDNVNTQTSADVLDHLASELVDHDAASHTANNGVGNSVSHWANQPQPRNDSLQETFKELSPDDSAKICKLVLF